MYDLVDMLNPNKNGVISKLLDIFLYIFLCNYFHINVSVLAVVFRRQFSKSWQFQVKFLVFLIRQQNATASAETFTEK